MSCLSRLWQSGKRKLLNRPSKKFQKFISSGLTLADLRHSHISLLIDMGFSAVAIADRVGHESIEITYRYAHLFPSKQNEMVEKLELERSES